MEVAKALQPFAIACNFDWWTEDAADGLILSAADPLKIYNGCGKYSLNQSASLVKQSKYVITHDTGFMHIAAAFRKNYLHLG